MAYNFDAAWQSLLKVFSGDQMQTREGVRENSWLLPIIQQVRGRTNYLEAVKVNFRDSWTGRTGRMRRSKIIQKTSKIRYKRSYESIVKTIKTMVGSLKPPGNLRPRTREIYPAISRVGNRINGVRLPSIWYSPYARVPGVQEMNTWEYMEPLWGSAQRIIFMLRVWFRRAIRNAGTRPPLPNRLPLLRLTYNPALD